MAEKRRILKDFVASDALKFIKTDDALYHYFSLNTDNANIRFSKDNLSSYYFIEDKKDITFKTNAGFSKNYIDFIKKEIKDNFSTSKNVEELTEDILLNSNEKLNFIQNNGNFYFINNELFKDSRNNSSSYKLNLESNIKDEIASYVSAYYDERFFNDAQNTNNKGIPIYNFGKSALLDVTFLKIDRSEILKILEKYELSEISSNILYNSETNSLDDANYDSIFIKGIINGLKEGISYKGLFEELFSIVNYNSFYRELIPVGVINKIKDNDSIAQDGMTDANELNQYLYSFDIQNSNLSKAIPTNYFSLKTLKNPEYEQDYVIESYNDDESIKAQHFDFEMNVISQIIKMYREEVIATIKEYLNERDLRLISSILISRQ